MRKLYKNIVLFFTPLLFILLVAPVNTRLKYQELKNDCFNHGIWIYDRIQNNSKPVDIAFLGSSQTINGINDKLIETEMNKTGLSVVNFGYCRLGKNLIYVLLKEIVKTKHPKYVIIEIKGDEDRYSHPVFPYIADTRDVVLANPFFNRDLLGDMYLHFFYKMDLIQEKLFREAENTDIRTDDFGFASSADTATAEVLEKYSNRCAPKPALSKLERNFHMHFPRVYLKKIHKLCEKNRIELYFLYIPVYCTCNQQPRELNTYTKYGKVIIPPCEIFNNPSVWHDENHLNQAGADEFSLWLSKVLMVILQ